MAFERPGDEVVLPPGVRRAIVERAREARPHECCGLLVGRGRHVLFAVAARNLATIRTRFELDPRLHIDLRRLLRQVRPPLSIVGVYHSHPTGAAVPSATDVAESCYPDWIHVIAGLGGSRAEVRAWRIADGRAVRLTCRPSAAVRPRPAKRRLRAARRKPAAD